MNHPVARLADSSAQSPSAVTAQREPSSSRHLRVNLLSGVVAALGVLVYVVLAVRTGLRHETPSWRSQPSS